MSSSQISVFLLFTIFFSIVSNNFTQLDFPIGFDGAERDALLALEAEFNNSFLKKNWTGLMCYLNASPYWYGIDCINGRVTGISLENMALTGKIRSNTLYNLTELSTLSLKNNSISGKMMDLSKNPKLTRVDLSRNMFSGEISNSLTKLNFLESLQLQENNFIGNIPDFNQPSLREFNVSNNNLSGPIPNTNIIQSFGATSFIGNKGLCGMPKFNPCNNTEKLYDQKSNSSKNKGVFGTALGPILLAIGAVGLVVLLFLLLIYYKKLKNKIKIKKLHDKTKDVPLETSEKSFLEGDAKEELFFMNENESFQFNDLLKSSAEGLGTGSFGNSYKAVLGNGSAFVVKRLRDLKPLSHVEFLKILKAIDDQKHPNLLPLVAYYYSKEDKLLIYKFAAYGNVFTRLHGGRETAGRIPFRWSARLSTAQAVARALNYLHLSTDNSPNILVPHGNLKSSNVLIDENDNILVSDYNLGSLITLHVTSQKLVAYKSPEYKNHKKLSKKSDVWSYGCFLLELLTGRVSTQAAPQGETGVDLAIWAHRAVREEWTAEIFDVEILVQKSASHAMFRLLQIAIRCCDKSPEKRPEMREVLREVENIKVVEDSEKSEDLSLEQSLTDDSLSMSN